MSSIFPEPILDLPEADLPFEGAKSYLSQGENHQIIFMEFEKDAEVPEHSHESQWEIVLEGKVDYWEDGVKYTFAECFLPLGIKNLSPFL